MMQIKPISPDEIPSFYSAFDSPITRLDCGQKCAPYNVNRTPFCCDITHAVPTAYLPEFDYLQANTDLWHRWASPEEGDQATLERETPVGQVLIACKGAAFCERNFRTITCRSFPFFPYISRDRKFLGLSVYWEYEDRCWVISNLEKVLPGYIQEFTAAYERLFSLKPSEFDNFSFHSTMMRRIFGRRKRSIPLLHRNGYAYKITPRNGRMRRVPASRLPKHEPFATAARLPFLDELDEVNDER